jgi:hypothetical protein
VVPTGFSLQQSYYVNAFFVPMVFKRRRYIKDILTLYHHNVTAKSFFRTLYVPNTPSSNTILQQTTNKNALSLQK